MSLGSMIDNQSRNCSKVKIFSAYEQVEIYLVATLPFSSRGIKYAANSPNNHFSDPTTMN